MPSIIVRADKATSYTPAESPTYGTTPASHVPVFIDEWMDSLQDWETEFLEEVGIGGELATRRPQWGEGGVIPDFVTFAGGLPAATTTGATVATGDAVLLHRYLHLNVYEVDPITGFPDFTTREQVMVDNQPTADNAVNLVRGWGDTSPRTFGPNARGYIDYSSLPEGQDFVKSPDVFGSLYDNRFQMFFKAVGATEQENRLNIYEYGDGPHLTRKMELRRRQLRKELQKAIILGEKNVGDGATNNAHTMDGLWGFVQSGNVWDLAGRRLTPYDIDSAGAKLWHAHKDIKAKRLLMSMNTARLFDGQLDRYRQADMGTTRVDQRLTAFVTRLGEFTIQHTPDFPDGLVIGCNVPDLKVRPYAGQKWHEKEIPTKGPYMERAIYGEYTLVVKNPSVLFALYNFDTNLDNYRGLFKA
jgi:hypothetical protein